MHPFIMIADRAAREAGRHIMQALKRLDKIQIYEKNNNSLVTEVDYAVEKVLINHISAAYPMHSILSEEGGENSRPRSQSDYTWIIDPLDGTTNFIHGFPSFAISIAVQYKGYIEHALIYDPFAQETFYASRGKGSRLSQQRIRVSNRDQLRGNLLFMNFPIRESEQIDSWLAMMRSFLEKGMSIRSLGSAALGLAYVATGRLDSFLSTLPLKIWDIAAGSLLVQESGGIVYDLKGNDKYLQTGQMIAANPKLSQLLVESSRAFT